MAVAAPRPNGHDITAETTGLDLVALPGDGQRSELVLHLAVTETHEWFGIGGASGRLRRPRLLTRDKRLPLASSGPDYLRSADDCRRLIVRGLMHVFRDEGFRGLSAADWDAAVPQGVEARVAESSRALPAGRACRCEVSIRVGVEFVYSEPAALLRACTDAGDLMSSGTAGGDGAAPPCSICLEEMARDAGATCLPGRCIGRWFQKASTCPVCRRDKLQYLPPGYMAVHDMMHSDPEGSC
ncbi:hypothetical protein GQ55_5G029900 [Panicum hallii var. hallii]|uniref:RING-type domain-containing protein n=1 Tax=Panicum hallii var. hallii TaxID=1504633 RepID=A0A2T7DC17_9POAL|nr:hypothetical protein GQ55_5G029900 [Panicum hallii var. hallii]